MTKEEYLLLSEEEKIAYCQSICWAMVKGAEKHVEEKGSGNHGTYSMIYPFTNMREGFRDLLNNMSPEMAKQLEDFAAQDTNKKI